MVFYCSFILINKYKVPPSRENCILQYTIYSLNSLLKYKSISYVVRTLLEKQILTFTSYIVTLHIAGNKVEIALPQFK